MGAVVLPSGMDHPFINVGVGFLKQTVSTGVEVLTDWSGETEATKSFQWWLRPSNEKQRAGANANILYGAVMLFRSAPEIHHLLPKGREFIDKFRRVGLDVEDFTITLERARHRLKPDGLHTGAGEENWNGAWRRFFRDSPAATRDEILQQLGRMKKAFGLEE